MSHRIFQMKYSLDFFQKFVCYKHKLLPGSSTTDLVEISNSVCGLHSARLPTSYVMIQPRHNKPSHLQLWEEIYQNNNLIKLRCMRKTLHTVSVKNAPIFHKSTLGFRLQASRKVYNDLSVSRCQKDKIKKSIIGFVSNLPQKPSSILSYLLSDNLLQKYSRDECIVIYKNSIKHYWEKGTLCYLNRSKHWGSEDRYFGLTEDIYPGIGLNLPGTDDAVKSLVIMHIKSFGPATIKDISWWSGISVSKIKKAIDSYHEIIPLRFEQYDSEFYVHEKDLDAILTADLDNNFVKLLAYEDSTIKGYFESRSRYVDKQYYDNLFNQIGECRASIIINGRAKGTWFWDKKNKQIKYQLFDNIQNDLLVLLESELAKMEEYLGYNNKQLQLPF